jgi:hypothetical protein
VTDQDSLDAGHEPTRNPKMKTILKRHDT